MALQNPMFKRWSKYLMKALALITPVVLALSHATPAKAFQRGIQIDPGFAYYQGRTEESIAEELKLNGFTIVHYFITNENNINVKLVEELKKAGLEVWALVLGNGSYSVANFPSNWESWQMKHIKTSFPGFYHFCMNNEEYREWKKASLARVIQSAPFDGVELAESYLPEVNGFSTGGYACVCDTCLEIFREKWQDEAPEFVDQRDPRYYRRVPETYEKWIEFRVYTVSNFLNDIVNGKGGLREARPDIIVSTWSLGIDSGRRSVEMMRELQGLDDYDIVKTVRPDRHTIQTHWPDWTKANLPPDYIKAYEPFAEPVREHFPEVELLLQTDIGSQEQMRRSDEWMEEFYKVAEELGYHSVMSYEYHLGLGMYQNPPTLKMVTRLSGNRLQLSFDRRLDFFSSTDMSKFTFLNHDSAYASMVVVDGNRIILLLGGVDDSEEFDLDIGEIESATDVLLLKGYPRNGKVVGTIHVPPAGESYLL
jgi:hypothetical protein